MITISRISRDTYKKTLSFIPEIKKRLKNPRYGNDKCLGLYCRECPFGSSNLNISNSSCGDIASGMGPHWAITIDEARCNFEDFVRNFDLVEVDW